MVKDASHLIPVSKSQYINDRILGFLGGEKYKRRF